MANGISRTVDFSSYKAIRDEIAHEDNLMGTRLNWFLASQSFLLTALAIAHSGSDHEVPPTMHNDFYFPLVPLLAIVSCTLILMGIIGGAAAIRRWRRQLQTMILQDATLPAIGKDGWIMRFGWAAPLLLPLLFMAAWTYLLVVGFLR